MKKILKKIKKEIKSLDPNQQSGILSYYEEIISDRLENGETIEQIDQSIDYSNIVSNEDNIEITIKKPAKTTNNNKLLLIILTFPIWIVILSLVFSFYVVMLSVGLVVVLIPVYIILIVVDLLMNNTAIADVAAYTGLILIGLSVITYILYLLLKVMKSVNTFIVTTFKSVIKGAKQWN